MNLLYCDDPWKHLIVDNFLESGVFKYVLEYINEKYPIENIKSSICEVHTKNSNSKLYALLSPIIMEIKDKYFDELNFTNKKLPNNLFPYVELVICSPNFKYDRIHTDFGHFKEMTTVVYVNPENGDGTELYTSNNKKSLHKIVEWKPNRALIFVGQEDKNFKSTWHNYRNMKNEYRITLNLILSNRINGKY